MLRRWNTWRFAATPLLPINAHMLSRLYNLFSSFVHPSHHRIISFVIFTLGSTISTQKLVLRSYSLRFKFCTRFSTIIALCLSQSHTFTLSGGATWSKNITKRERIDTTRVKGEKFNSKDEKCFLRWIWEYLFALCFSLPRATRNPMHKTHIYTQECV